MRVNAQGALKRLSRWVPRSSHRLARAEQWTLDPTCPTLAKRWPEWGIPGFHFIAGPKANLEQALKVRSNRPQVTNDSPGASNSERTGSDPLTIQALSDGDCIISTGWLAGGY